MYENELTQAFCVPCFATMVRWEDTRESKWECPECGPHSNAQRDAAA